jgi:hypothetical protein
LVYLYSGIIYFPDDRVMHFLKEDSDAPGRKSSTYVNNYIKEE